MVGESHLVAGGVILAGELVLAGEAVLVVDLGEGVRLGLGVVGVQVAERQDFVGLLGRKLGLSHKTCDAWVLAEMFQSAVLFVRLCF